MEVNYHLNCQVLVMNHHSSANLKSIKYLVEKNLAFILIFRCECSSVGITNRSVGKHFGQKILVLSD